MGTEEAVILEPLITVLAAEAAGGIADDSDKIPPWKEQITTRGLVVSGLLGCLFCIITHKLNLTVGVIPSLNVAAGLLGFFLVRSWTGILNKLGFQVAPFTRQENTVIQTCVVACYGLAFSGELDISCLEFSG
ncbi:putative metal-nicotianamine transporter YSL6 [Platanthera guangdongensis]|uniref:Metal-nicotianamine transporter YSL6 n=1 Tax=Platanthera guangdongensis TaxID=2320717 RepID=A0ABR2LCZ7_9ASPA